MDKNILHLLSNALKFVGGWGSDPDPAGGAYDAPPDPLFAKGFAPSAHARVYAYGAHTSTHGSHFSGKGPMTQICRGAHKS